MGKMNDFVLDFLEIVQHKEKETYEHKNWDWDNLPEIKIMFEVINRYDKKSRVEWEKQIEEDLNK